MAKSDLTPEEAACLGGPDPDQPPSRREFLAKIRGASTMTLASTAMSLGASAEAGQDVLDGAHERARDSYQVREEVARAEKQVPIPKQITNGDEQKYRNFIGNYSKGLPHNAIGEVDPSAYRSLLSVVRRGTAAAFEQVPLAGNTKLVNPLAGSAFDLEGTDSHQLAIPPFPAVASQALADEAVELYWMALCRDVHFTNFATDLKTLAAVSELSKLPAFAGVTSETLFRGFTAGDLIGPYISQFLLKPFNYGPYEITGRINVCVPGVDYLTSEAAWLACRNGQGPFPPDRIDAQPRYIRNGRDLATYVHLDTSPGGFMAFHNAGIFLFASSAPLNPGNPYRKYKRQSAFGTFGAPHFLGLLGEAAQRALKAVWYAKWFVHRALRPEDFGGLVHMSKTRKASYPLNGDILNSAALAIVYRSHGTYFLPQAYPEGCPQHPSYAQGHASIAGACATILKAAFDGDAPFSALTSGGIVTASEGGLSLVPYTSSDASQITVNGEINKLASNIGLGRNFAGVHWRSDCTAGLILGEAVAISILGDQRDVYAGEDFAGFTITKFDGTTIAV
jgi:PAP2 superfamily